MDAYANNDKIEHESIVIVKLPDGIGYEGLRITNTIRELIRENCPAKGYYEYFWNLKNKGQINSFLEKRKEIHNTVFQEIKKLYTDAEYNLETVCP